MIASLGKFLTILWSYFRGIEQSNNNIVTSPNKQREQQAPPLPQIPPSQQNTQQQSKPSKTALKQAYKAN